MNFKTFTAPALLALSLLGTSVQAQVMAVPCFAGRPGRWLVTELPKGVGKFMILQVNKMMVRDIPSHPNYDPRNPDLYEYAICAIVPRVS